MADNTEKSEPALETLSDEEQKLLAKVLKKVEAEIFYKVVRRLSAWIVVVLTLLLVGGLINFSSCSSNVENSAAIKLAGDPEVRDKIVNRVEQDLKDIQDKLKTAND